MSRVTSGMMHAYVRRGSTSFLNSSQTSFHLRERARSVANTERCPICNVAVKPENLPRHLNDIHPRHPDMPRFRDELKAELGRNAPRNAARPFRIRKIHVAVVLVIVVIGVGAYYASFPREPSGDKVLTYCGAEGIVMHYHALLVINYNGVQEHLPGEPPGESGYIGFLPQDTSSAYQCPGGGFHALHTHDGSGIIHCELPWGDVTPNLGEFFTIWGQPLSSGGAWIYSGSVSAKVVDMDAHTTTDYSSNAASIPFYHPAGGPYSNPYSIPQNLIFYGQYGNGQSSGFFAGEVVYLNITA